MSSSQTPACSGAPPASQDSLPIPIAGDHPYSVTPQDSLRWGRKMLLGQQRGALRLGLCWVGHLCTAPRLPCQAALAAAVRRPRLGRRGLSGGSELPAAPLGHGL